MDGNFVDNISFGPAMIAAVRKHTKMFLDVHLMIHRADHYLDRFLKAGADNISIHVEAKYDTDVETTLKRIKAAGRSAGIVINPATPFDAAKPYLPLVDLLLVMTVVPGFGGQPFMEKETMPKLAAGPRLARVAGIEISPRSRWRHLPQHRTHRPQARRQSLRLRHIQFWPEGHETSRGRTQQRASQP